jgi:hypothetical protein
MMEHPSASEDGEEEWHSLPDISTEDDEGKGEMCAVKPLLFEHEKQQKMYDKVSWFGLSNSLNSTSIIWF